MRGKVPHFEFRLTISTKFNWEKCHNDIYKSKKNIFVKRISKEKLKEVVDVGVDGKDTEGLIFILINFDLIKWVYERKVAKKPETVV